jgi:hypothetical protein
MSKTPAGTRRAADFRRTIIKGGFVGLEQLASSVPSLDIDCFYRDGHRQFRRHRAGTNAGLGGLLATAAARLAPAQRFVHVCAAVFTRPSNGEQTGMKKTKPPSASQSGKSPSALIDARIKELGDWRGEMLGRLRALIKEADPDAVEEWKWRGVPVWYHDGIICTGETYKNTVKMTFAKGAAVPDPAKLFNASLEGNTRRGIDFHEGDTINETALKTLIRAAVSLNKPKAKA